MPEERENAEEESGTAAEPAAVGNSTGNHPTEDTPAMENGSVTVSESTLPESLADARFGLIGTGQMGSALVGGWLKSGVLTTDQITATDVSEASRNDFFVRTGIAVRDSNTDIVRESDVIILAVKPQVFADVAAEIRKYTANKLFLSILAGTTLATLRDRLGPDCRIIRAMSNTPCLVGLGACAFSPANSATEDDARLAATLLGAVGMATQLDESLLDAVTGLSGSGPAFVYMMIEALADGGVKSGLPRAVALQLAAQTVYGSAVMVQRTGEHPGVLKDRVCSPGGTTIAGVAALEDGGMRGSLIRAVVEATHRSRELSAK